MATTITYKGEVLARITGQTKTLKTAGKYMEGDVSITDTSKSIALVSEHANSVGGMNVDIASVTDSPLPYTDTLDAGGGTIRNIMADVVLKLQSKEVALSNSQQTVLPDNGYDGLSEVVVQICDNEAEENDVVFIDYDGTRLYSYTQDEFLALSALPANPTHTGLTSQGWNWTLEDAKAHVQSYKYLVIGQSYITDDGKTRLYVTIDESNPSKKASVVFKSTPANNTTIDWGDGTTSVGSPNNYGASHTYDAYGDYVITLTVNSGTIALGYNGSNYSIGGISSTNPETLTAVRKIELGANISEIYRQCFSNLLNLETITIPLGVGDMRNSNGAYFNQSMSLKAVVIPSGCNCIAKNFATDSGVRYVSIPKQTREITTTLTEMFTRARHLRMLTLPEITVSEGATVNLATGANVLRHVTVPFTGTVAIGGIFLRDCYNLSEVTVPADVVSIADYAFYGCWGLRKLHMLPTTPPTLANTRAFQGLMGQSGRKIYVPYSEDHSILEAYKTATNWSSFASNIEEESND